MDITVPRLVITGGPCGGKSSAMKFLTEKLSALGYLPFVVPEAPTILINSGMTPVGGLVPLRAFQESVLELIMTLEDAVVRSAQDCAHPKPIILCDRGLMDASAYMPREMFLEITALRGLDIASLRDARYHAVFHLRSAAVGAEEHYTTANNSARFETIDEARAVDERTLLAWIGHPSVAVIGNVGAGFDAKLETLWRHVLRSLGEPEPYETERRFLVAPTVLTDASVPHERIEIEQLFIASHGLDMIRRVRERRQGSAAAYFETSKSFVRPGVAREIEHAISQENYERLRQEQLQGSIVLKKTRHCFVYRDQYFELDEFLAPHEGLFILEIELNHEDDPVELPPFLNIIEEITGRKEFSNYALATSAHE